MHEVEAQRAPRRRLPPKVSQDTHQAEWAMTTFRDPWNPRCLEADGTSPIAICSILRIFSSVTFSTTPCLCTGAFLCQLFNFSGLAFRTPPHNICVIPCVHMFSLLLHALKCGSTHLGWACLYAQWLLPKAVRAPAGGMTRDVNCC